MDKVLKSIPILSAIFIFFGYCNQHFFYGNFGIPIYNFISSGEIVLSFLQIALEVLSFLFYFFIMHFVIMEPEELKAIIRERKKRSFIWFLSFLLERGKRRKLPSKKRWKVLCIAIRKGLTSLYFFLGVGTVYILTGDRLYNNIELALIILVLWILNIGPTYLSKMNLKLAILGRHEYQSLATLLLLSLYFIVFIYVSNNLSAQRILRGKPSQFVEFIYNNEVVKSNNQVVFIGGTQGYIFLRDLRKKQNLIFDKASITHFKVRNELDSNIEVEKPDTTANPKRVVQ